MCRFFDDEAHAHCSSTHGWTNGMTDRHGPGRLEVAASLILAQAASLQPPCGVTKV